MLLTLLDSPSALTRSEVIIGAFALAPTACGLPGYDHPCSLTVVERGLAPLLTSGLVEQPQVPTANGMAPGHTFRLTAAGTERATHLAACIGRLERDRFRERARRAIDTHRHHAQGQGELFAGPAKKPEPDALDAALAGEGGA
ncbi:MAG: hypothetical protein JNK72_24990 [Myxococcales bacterium]|nr:hypothetical protein [Myxococcales bacterium]